MTATVTTGRDVISELRERFPEIGITEQKTADGIPTVWVDREHIRALLAYLKSDIPEPYRMLFDITAIDERARRTAEPPNCRTAEPDFTVVYQLLSFERVQYFRVKTPLRGEYPSIPTITDLWPNANWYEREIWDMFGIR